MKKFINDNELIEGIDQGEENRKGLGNSRIVNSCSGLTLYRRYNMFKHSPLILILLGFLIFFTNGFAPALISSRVRTSSRGWAKLKLMATEAELVNELRRLVDQSSQIGVDSDEGVVRSIESVVEELEKYQEGEELTKVPLRGTHRLLFSMAKGGSNGKLGPFVGAVNQEFEDDQAFVNSVTLGPLSIRLSAQREILTDRNVRVKFKSTSVRVFGQEVVNKETKGAGVWSLRYFKDGLRIMDTPSLFIIEEVK